MASKVVKEQSHAASLRRQLNSLGSLSCETNHASSDHNATDDDRTKSSDSRTSLAFTHPSLCATGIPDMGGGLGVVAMNPTCNSSDTSSSVQRQQWLKASSPIMRVPSRALVTGKSARRWLYQLVREAVEMEGCDGDNTPLLMRALSTYVTHTNHNGDDRIKGATLTTFSIPNDAALRPSGNAGEQFLARVEHWLLSLTSIQCIAMYLFLMKTMPSTDTSSSLSDNVITEDRARHELHWGWVQHLPRNYDNLLELELSSHDLRSIVWSPTNADKVALEIDNWQALFRATMLDRDQRVPVPDAQPSHTKVNKSRKGGETSELETESDSDDDAQATVTSEKARTRGDGFLSLADMLEALFELRPALLASAASGLQTGKTPLLQQLTLAIQPKSFLWAYNSLMSRGFACHDETWVMMPYVDYFNYGFHEDAADEEEGARLVAGARESCEGSTVTSSFRQRPHLCSNLAVEDYTPRAEVLSEWIQQELAGTKLSPSLSEVERLVSWAASEHSVRSRLWSQGRFGKNPLRGDYLRKRVPSAKEDDTPTVTSSSSLTWLSEAKRVAEAALTIVPSYNPLTVCQFGTTADVPLMDGDSFSSEPTSAGASPAYHQFLLCYGTYMDFELALWYGFTLTDTVAGSVKEGEMVRLGHEGLALATIATNNDLGSNTSVFASSFPTPPSQPLLRHHVANSFSFSPLGNAIGDYPSTRAIDGYSLVAKRLHEGLACARPQDEGPELTETFVVQSLSDYKANFLPNSVGSQKGSKSSPVAGQSKKGLNRSNGFTIRAAPANGMTSASRLPLPSVFLSATDDTYKSYHSGSGDLRFSKAGCSTDLLQACEHLAIRTSPAGGDGGTSALPLPLMMQVSATFWLALRAYIANNGTLPATDIELVEPFLVQIAAFQNTFATRNEQIIRSLGKKATTKAPAAKRARELNGKDAAAEFGDSTAFRNNGLCPHFDVVPLDEILALSSEALSMYRAKAAPTSSKNRTKPFAADAIPVVGLVESSASLSAVRVAMVLQFASFGEFLQLEASRTTYEPTNSVLPATMANHFALQSSIAQWALLRDIANVAITEGRPQPLQTLEHALKVLHILYDGRGGQL